MFFKNKSKLKLKGGQIMLLTTIFFMAFSLIISLGLVNPIIKQASISSDLWKAKESYFVSEAGAEDTLYRVKSNMTLGTTEVLSLNGYYATTSILDTADGKTLTTGSDRGGYIKKIETKVSNGSGGAISFVYGMQAGTGGISISGSSGIIGNVYSNGLIDGCTSCYVTGSVIVANSPSMFIDQSNELPSSPSNSVTFDDTSSTQDMAQSFKISSTSPITQVSVYLKKVGNPSDINVKIIKDSSGSPSKNSGDVVASAVLSASLVSVNYGWVDVSLSPNPSLALNTTYWLVLDGASDSTSNKYLIGANLDSNYSNGVSKIGKIGSTWTNTGYDTYFRIFLGGFFGQIKGTSQWNQFDVGTGGTGIAYAHNVSYVSATGDIRCQVGLLNNKVCNTSYSDPSPVPYPVSDANIQSWKNEATAGGIINTNYTVDGSNKISLSSKRINGNLTVSGSGELTLTGTIYVTGNVTISGSGKIKLATSYGTKSGIIVTDGRVTIPGSGQASGSGQSGSYLMIVTTSDCPASSSCGGDNAIEMSGSGGAVILNAQKGTLDFSGSAYANEAAANKIIMSGSTIVKYEDGLISPNFSSGSSGGFSITGWRELEQ